MPFQWKRIVHLILYFLTIFVVVIVKNSIFHLITVGCSTCMIMMMNASGAEGGASSSSSFFEGLSDLVKNPAEPGSIRSLIREPGSGFLVRSKSLPRA